MTEADLGVEQSVALERQARLDAINGVLARHDLAHPCTLEGLGDVTRGEIEILGAEDVIRLGSEGLHLVKLPAQFAPDTKDPETGEIKPGARGTFWTFLQTNEAAAENNIYVPFVRGAQSNFPTPREIPRADASLEQINQRLAELHLKPLPPTVNAAVERVTGIADLCDVNARFFTVVIYDVQQPNGEIVQRPIVYNANSDSGFDGTVFDVTVRAPQYGMEPRLMLARAYRPNIGGWLLETSRGFYSPRLGGERRGFQAKFTDVPVLKRAVEEASDETGLLRAENIKDMGKIPQDPAFEASEASYFSLDTTSDAFGPQDLEVSEKIRLQFLSLGEFFSKLPEINDPFTLTAIARHLLANDILRLSRIGMAAQNEGEQMAFVEGFRFQHGRFLTEAIRGAENSGLPVDYHLGRLPVNTGIARIMPEVMYGTTDWEVFKNSAKIDLQNVRLLYPFEALRAIAYGQFDSVTAAAAIKALHARRFLELNFSAVQ